jgi:hypothetical protein
MRHPREETLALFTGGDLGAFARWRVSRHLATCERCRGEIRRFERATAVLHDEADRLPPRLNWDRLAAEMTGNIRVGLAAGECVAPAPAPRQSLGWRPAALVAMLTLAVLGGWFLKGPRMWMPMPASPQIVSAARPVLDGTADGIEVKASGGALTLLNTRAASPAVYVSAPGTLRARFVDSETGQITINNVYAE